MISERTFPLLVSSAFFYPLYRLHSTGWPSTEMNRLGEKYQINVPKDSSARIYS